MFLYTVGVVLQQYFGQTRLQINSFLTGKDVMVSCQTLNAC